MNGYGIADSGYYYGWGYMYVLPYDFCCDEYYDNYDYDGGDGIEGDGYGFGDCTGGGCGATYFFEDGSGFGAGYANGDGNEDGTGTG